MGHSKASMDESDIVELLALKGEVLQNREDTHDTREGGLDDLRKDVHAIHLKQDTMTQVMSGVQDTVSALNMKLAATSMCTRPLLFLVPLLQHRQRNNRELL